ncbi:hypothetical protein EPUL_004332, partial [Erysiphe pulchra]
MSPPILPAYSLRVQLFLSTACDSEDKPVRNFRVVTSPEITVREFCQEAARIHEINYGLPLVIKRVQDDQAFDVTQSEILGNLFGTSSIVRVVQASKHPGIRDSIPPTSALRFNPLVIGKRERHYDDLVPNLESSWRSSKRQKFHVTDPDSPLPSRESDAASPPNSCHLSNSQIDSAPGKFVNTEKFYPKKPKCQISETPEPVSKSWQNLRAPETKSVGTQKYSKSNYHEQQNSSKHKVKKGYRQTEPGTIEYQGTSQHISKLYLPESSASSAQSSINLEQSPAINVSTQSPKFGKNPIPGGMQKDLNLDSIHNQVAKKKSLKYNAENLKNQGINNIKSSFKKAQIKSITVPGSADGKLVTEISQGAKVLDTSENNYSLKEIHSEKITSRNLNYKSHIQKVEQQNNCIENSSKGTKGIDTFKAIQDVHNKQKKKKRKKKKEITQKSEPQSNSIVEVTQNRQGNKSSQELEAKKPNNDSMAKREQIPPSETKSFDNHLNSKTVLHGKKSHHKLTAFSEKSKDDLNSNSPSLKPTSRNIVSSSVIPPPRERKGNPAIESLQAQNSPNLETLNPEKKPTNDPSNHIIPPSNTTVPKNEEKKKDVASRISNQIFPNTPASLQPKSLTPNSSNIKDTKCIIPLQKKSFTPILPPQKSIDISNILIAIDDSKTRTTRSKTASAAKIIPTKITPVVRNKESQPTKPNNKSKIPNGISNKESISIKSYSKGQDSNLRNNAEIFESFNKKDGVDEALANSIVETSSNKENIQEASINSQPENLKELQNIINTSKAEDDELNREETQSQNSSDRDSRSPIEFHQNFQPKIFHRTPSLSSNSHSDIEDSRINDDTPSSVLDDSGNSSDVEVGNELKSQEKTLNNYHFQSEPINSINTQLSLDYQEPRPNSSHSILRVQVPNSSPALKRNPPSNFLTNTNVPDSSLNEVQGNPSNSFIPGPVVDPSSLEVKKPQFKFGASLSEIHRSGGLLSMSQTSRKSNERNILAMSLATETQSESESENSDTSFS